MKRFFKCMMSAVLALGVLSGAASAVPQTEEAAVSEEQTDDSAFAESAADLVSGESMVYLPSGMRAVMLTPTVDFVAACTAEAVVCGFADVLEVCCVFSSGISAVSG